MKNKTRIFIALLAACGSAGAEVTVIDDFSGELSGYTATVILDANGGASNVSTWQTYEEQLEVQTTSFDGIEQWAYIRDGLTLPVGKEVRAQIDHYGNLDMGLYVGGNAPVAGVRENYITVYARNTGQVSSRGFDGTSEFGVAATGANIGYDTLFIARTDTNTYEAGYYSGTNRIVIATRTPATPNSANAVGIYADVRDGTEYLGSVDNLTIADISPGYDSDGDGLIDTFETTYFGDLNEAADGDPDGDGFSNLEEMNAGSDPTIASSVPADLDGNGTLDANEHFQPYTVDANTLHLWHFDETLPPTTDLGSDPVPLQSLEGDAYLWAPSHAGFGTGLNPNRSDTNGTGGYLSALPLADGDADNTNITLAGENGAFTFEAIVKLGFDPTTAPYSVNPMQILSGDGEETALERGFQFRILPVFNSEHGGGPVAELEFLGLNYNGTGTDVSRVKAPLPTGDDPDAAVEGRWYHVAVSYNGNPATPDNLTLYWTLLDPERTSARVLATGQLEQSLNPDLTPDFVIGNEGKSNGGASDAFLGVIDEVRISNIARDADDFLFSQVSEPNDAYDDFVSGLPTDQRGENDDPDGDGYSNLIEFAFNTDPENSAEKPAPLSTGVVMTGAALNETYSLSLDPAKSYRLVEVEVPTDLQGMSLKLEVSQDLTFSDGLMATEVGTPTGDGTSQTRRFVLTPATDDASRLFWRLSVSR
ncbi:hypothetical protein JIN85_08860 [Luteolibacter pohnpeiensis]|uniref:LamG-like jellyroll fold domain-containing protein n=1 Tax=Luteolibacter pohnpeiensis TaxID=454153 RepID=A0A934S7A1_9BACT|nr:LamG-like jellyroll fold domain-containing protein [Luteolibacter pohnpeiensis]MBK1882524.1 hypothetical protein [Luteolibacter pohnpeiensis]